MKLHPADYAWIALVSGVIVWEIAAPPGELPSQVVDRYLQRHPILTRTAIIITAAHLLNLLDKGQLRWIDPYAHASRLGNRQ